MPTVACETGWYKDPYHTAPDSPCVLTADWLHAGLAVGTVGYGFGSLLLAATIATLWYAGESWLSARVRGYCTALCFQGASAIAAAIIWADPAGELVDPSASMAWRGTIAIGWFLFLANLGFFWFSQVLAPAIQFVGGIDTARCGKLDRLAKRGMGASMVCWLCIAYVGACIMLFGATESTQDTGVILFYGGIAAGDFFLIIVSVHIAQMLHEVHSALNAASESAKQIVNLRRYIHFNVVLLAYIVLQCVTVATWGTLRALSGIIQFGVLASVTPFGSAAVLYYEHRRLLPARSTRSTRVIPMRSGATGSALRSRFGHSTVASVAAAATGDIAQGMSSTSIAITANGVSLQLMRDFADERGVDDSMTAGEVCAQHVKAVTAEAQTALVRVLQEGRDSTGALWCGKPTSFISYAWSYPFRLLIDIVEQFEAENPAPPGQTQYYFLDQFSLNQHKFVNEGANQIELQAMVVEALQTEMRRSAHVLMCMHPWNQPVPLRRMWCLFELFTAVNTGVDVTMCFGEDDATALCAAISNGYFDANDAVGDIDAANAGASVASDKDMIIKLIEQQAGMDRFNAEMREYLLKAFKATVTRVQARQLGRGTSEKHRRNGKPLTESDVASGSIAGDQVRSPTCTLEGRVVSQSQVVALGGQMASLSEQMASLDEQMGSRITALEGEVTSRLTRLEEQIAALVRAVHGSSTANSTSM